ncbi:magnesium-translocating P-type ATPase [Extensimonas vulgaris]|uniref:Magnesium-transporting ATPase, P-type 1 n=1 Tax=Extensimonas vulgaris TaxID=1031594 RepID=A0A369ALH3_9BURK|nr:magnesium-translocating P-type ATPase [Extensimonas vulgaris]RCX10200.1 Mg2+-importing ATPase [Extensimonas vulgaris]TWI39778.1 Mg2+-importing ATPase [Extensimonas vulgaris]TXD17342.1 magnesium-translocating P-type ATPase [Extensimonas vulgaris]
MNLSLLKELFASFVRSRGLGRHFRRLVMLDSVASTTVSREVPPALAQTLVAAAQSDPDALLQQLGSHPEGLTEAQVEQLRERVGPNVIEQDKPVPWWLHLWRCYKTPFDLLLTLLAVISYLTEDMKATIVIGSMVVLSVAIRFWQERKSHVAADKLKAMVSNTATVMRRSFGQDVVNTAATYFDVQLHVKPPRRVEVPMAELVPGDIVLLSAGDMIPADCRILSAKDLFVSQAAMTGESLPVEKFATLRSTDVGNPLELENIVFMGTNVVSGSATAVVVHTGGRTYFGALAQRVTATSQAPTQFQAGVNKVAWLLIRFMFVMSPLVLLINGFTKGNWTEAFLFAMSIAVGLTPEMLPMIVTSTLAKGAVLLSRQKVIVKRLDAIQNFGAMDVLCTDKTGTLTQDKIFLARHIDVWGEESDDVLEMAYLNSYYQTGLKNLLDVAVLEHTEVHKQLNPAANYRKVDEIPFDFQRRRMSVVVSEREDHHLLICKGAVEEILSICNRVRHGEQDEPLTPELLERVRAVTADLNEDGLRVVAVACKEEPPQKDSYGVADEQGLTLIGYVAFLDPPKESTAPALKALAAHGVKVKVLTGDNDLVTAKICREVGLAAGAIVLGAAIEGMDDAELARVVEAHDVFAKLTPAHKDRIVRQLKRNGHVVGFMGDGINDAPALRSADIGISVDTAVDIAKEAADIILLEKSLLVLEEGVVEGRKTFANMLKYIKMTASSNFGNVFSVLVASAFIPFLPMLPMHLLVQNLLYDFSQTAIPFDNVDEELVKDPQRWNPADIGRFMLFFGPVSSVFDIVTFAVMWFVFGANSAEHQTLFQSGWFVEGLMTQTLVVHMIRTRKIPFLQSRPAPLLLATTAAIMAIGIFLPMGPLAHYFKLQPLPLAYFPILGLILLGYMLLTQAMKGFYARRFGWQ